MFNRNKFTDEELREVEKYEEYERRKNERIAKATGNFLYRYFINGFIWLASTLLISIFLIGALSVNVGLSTFIGIIASFILIFKVEYIKLYPFKSLIVLVFLIFLVMVAFDVR